MSGDEGDFWNDVKAARRQLRMRYGIECPRCKVKRPRADATILMPGQRCKVDNFIDQRPALTEQQYNLVDVYTEKDDAGVSYLVLHGGVVRWARRVAFGHDAAHRAGGSEFVDAAREQEAEARKLVPHGEIVEEIIDATIARSPT